MISFFGILQPGSGQRMRTPEAPGKISFFGGALLHELDRVASKRSAPREPLSPEEEEAERRFLQLCLPPGP